MRYVKQSFYLFMMSFVSKKNGLKARHDCVDVGMFT